MNVDLEYPEELHDLANDFPCASEHIGEGNNRRLISSWMIRKIIGYCISNLITEFPRYSLGLAHHLKGDTLMNKPIFIGSTMLDASKKVMYEFFMTTLNQNGEIRLSYSLQIRIVFV